MTTTAGPVVAARAFSIVALAAAAYAAVLLARYVYPPYIPRYRIESVLMIFAAAGVAAALARAPARRVEGPPIARFTAAHVALIAGLFAAATFFLYRSALDVGLLSDDFVLADWARRRQWVHLAETGFVRPMAPLVWAALAYLPADFDRAVHAANLVLHALNAALVVALGGRLGLRRDQALAAGVLFLTFPALTEAVVWASGVQDVLMTTLVLVAVIAALNADDSVAWAGAAVGATALALAVKETSVVVPALAGIVLWASGPHPGRRRHRQTLAVMAATVVAYAAYRLSVGVPAAYGQGVSRYFIKQLIVEPFAALGAPWSAVWMRTHPLQSVGRAYLILAPLAVGFTVWRRDAAGLKGAATAAAWVLLAVLPVFSFFHVAPDLQGSRYLYLPAVGYSVLLAVLASDAAARFPRRAVAPVFAAALLALVLPSIAAVRSEAVRWNDAARVRDRMLAALDGPALSRCSVLTAEGLADNVAGAFVFRNGLREAAAGRAGAAASSSGRQEPCRLIWLEASSSVQILPSSEP